MKRTVFSFLIGGILLAACGPGAPKAGTIIDKNYEPERHWTTQETYCIVRDTKTAVCSVYGTRPVYHHDDEDWKVKLEECHYDNSDGERKCRSGWREISSEKWKELKIGDEYSK